MPQPHPLAPRGVAQKGNTKFHSISSIASIALKISFCPDHTPWRPGVWSGWPQKLIGSSPYQLFAIAIGPQGPGVLCMMAKTDFDYLDPCEAEWLETRTNRCLFLVRQIRFSIFDPRNMAISISLSVTCIYVIYFVTIPVLSRDRDIYEILNFDDKINSFPTCQLSVSYFGDFRVPSTIQRPYQLGRYIPVDYRPNLPTVTQANILFQPVHPIFRSYLVPSCVIHAIIVPPGLSNEYNTVLHFTDQETSPYFTPFPPLYKNWNRKPRHKYFSYFNFALVAVFGNFDKITQSQISKTREIFQRPIVLMFRIAKYKRMRNCYRFSYKFSYMCQYFTIGSHTALDLAISNCHKLARPYFTIPLSGLESIGNHIVDLVTFVKQYSLHTALNLAFSRTTMSDENGTSQVLGIVDASLDIADPIGPHIPDPHVTDQSILLVGNWSFSFVTCSSLSADRVDYWGYLKPYNITVWHALLASCLFITFLLTGQNYLRHGMSISSYELAYVLFSARLDVCLTAFEGPGTTLRIMFKKHRYRRHEDTTAPLVSSPPKFFDDLVNHKFQIYSSPIVAQAKKFNVTETLTRYRVGESEFDAEIHTRFFKWMETFPWDMNYVLILILQKYDCPTVVNLARWYCGLFLSSELSENHTSQVTKIRQPFIKSHFSRIAGISQTVNASHVSKIVGKCEKTAFVAPSIYIESNMYLLSIFGG
ncbi:hypothetical protein Fcan01_17240 [Folsomia candida]|uniref:Uncharacterized protein n=1 Tax=Folsomia candida TaxID=158441 RepID=A0A226DRJ5_FOLCA|nr:hypothetical protein Fcan01_17240 [Folsomia candida]